jgi:hypothetical protein
VIQERDEHGRVVKSAGRRPGSRNKRARAADLLPPDALPTLYTQLYALAGAGDVQALRLLLDRLDPLRKGAPVEMSGMPVVTDAASALAASGQVLSLVAAGEVTPEEAAAIGRLIEAHVKAIEVHGLEARLTALEAKGSGRS